MPFSVTGKIAVALAAAPVAASLDSLTVLQWNPHWECFVSENMDTCGNNAFDELSKLLSDNAIDFANVVEINEESDVYQPPEPWQITTARTGQDSTALVYNSASWTPIGDAITGSVVDDQDRAFAVQAFQSTATSEKVIVVGAHFPHNEFDSSNLADAVAKAMSANDDALGVVFAADTNTEVTKSTASILKDAMPSLSVDDDVASSELVVTCCHDHGYDYHTYDRVAATFATSVRTELLFDPEPSWADIESPEGRAGEFHKAVLATFAVSSAEGQEVAVV
jgi:hypothetical protein